MMLFDVIQFKDYLKTTVYDIIVKRKNWSSISFRRYYIKPCVLKSNL